MLMIINARWDNVTRELGKELFESDIDLAMENVKYTSDWFPCFQIAEIQSATSGPITYTPDILPMVGPVPEMENYWCTFVFGYGVIHAGINWPNAVVSNTWNVGITFTLFHRCCFIIQSFQIRNIMPELFRKIHILKLLYTIVNLSDLMLLCSFTKMTQLK